MTQPRRRKADDVELPPIDPSGLPGAEGKRAVTDPQTVVLIRNAQLRSALVERDDLKARLGTATQDLSAARETLQAQSTELGHLRAVADQVEPLRAERDELRGRLTEVEGSVDTRVRDAVKAALDDAEGRHEATVEELAAERDDLGRQVEQLRGQLEDKGVTGRVQPGELAGQFASVLEELAAAPPTPGRPFGAALTSLEVDARGVLEAPREGEEQPTLRTVESGVDPGQLSTLRMAFRLLPHAGEPPPSPE